MPPRAVVAGFAAKRILKLSDHKFRGRREDLRLLTGQGRYTADHGFDGQVAGHFLRADRAHALAQDGTPILTKMVSKSERNRNCQTINSEAAAKTCDC